MKVYEKETVWKIENTDLYNKVKADPFCVTLVTFNRKREKSQVKVHLDLYYRKCSVVFVITNILV